MNDLVISVLNNGERVDKYIAGRQNMLTRSHIRKLIDSGHVSVNEKPVTAKYKVKAGDWIAVSVPEPENIRTLPEKIPITVLYEDDRLIVVDKPKGMVVHPAPGNYSGTMVNALLSHCCGNLSGINGKLRPGIVHRIDKDTSGVIVAAKTDSAYLSLAEQFKSHSVKREYLGLSEGVIAENSGIIRAPIGRHPNDRIKMAVNPINGKHAVTHFYVMERFQDKTFFKAILETGRTHQIRVHFAYIGHPLVGDPLYGRNKAAGGQKLHAALLGFVHPGTDEYMEFKSDLPGDFFT